MKPATIFNYAVYSEYIHSTLFNSQKDATDAGIALIDKATAVIITRRAMISQSRVFTV